MSLGWYLKSFIIWSPEFYQIHPPCLLIAIAVQPNRALCLPSNLSFPHFIPSLMFFPLSVLTCYLLFKLQPLSTPSHEAFLNHARRLVICYKFLPQFFLVPIKSAKFLAGITVRNTFCTGTHFVQTYVTHTHTPKQKLQETTFTLIIYKTTLML